MRTLFPIFLDVTGRDILLVGGGQVAAAKLRQLLAAGARVRVVAPLVVAEIASAPPAKDVEIVRRPFQASDIDGAWFVVAAATPEVNRDVADAAEVRHVFVNAVDDPRNATAYLSGVVRRGDVTIAISTGGGAPALTALLREALDAVLPRDLRRWVTMAKRQRLGWRRDGVPMDARKPLLLRALNDLYDNARLKPRAPTVELKHAPSVEVEGEASAERQRVPWLNAPEDSWL